MYKDVGKEIKVWAETIVILMTIPSVILGIAAMILLGQLADSLFWGIIVGAVLAGIGYFFARLAGILLYGYGELIEKASSIEEHLASTSKKTAKGKKVVPVKEKNDNSVFSRNSDGSWDCPFCDNHNPSNAAWCTQCGIEAQFE